MSALSLGARCTTPTDEVRGAPQADREGPLVERSSVPVIESPMALELADVNGDGHLDMLVGAAGVDVQLGDGQGNFRRAPGAPILGPKDVPDFAFGDFDGDGRVDVVVADHDQPRFWLLQRTARGRFEMSAESPFSVDSTPHLHTVATCDFDSDGNLDIVTDSWPESRLVLVRGLGDGTFETPGTQIEVPEVPIINLRMADMNGDGYLDIVTPAHESESVTVLLGDGGGFAHAPGSPYRSFGGFSSVALADLDGDGVVDVAESHRGDPTTEYKQDALSLLINDGAGRLRHAPGSPFMLSGRVSGVAIGDVDGDGHVDVATLAEITRVVTLLLGTEDGFEIAGSNPVSGRPSGVAIGDVDGDGVSEVLVTDAEGGRAIVLR